MGPLRFPEGFLWGAATAAHQVEGNLDNDWVPFEQEAGKIKNGDRSELGVDHGRRYDQDFALAQGMGHNAHRLSFEWSRLEPEPGSWNREAADHYHGVLTALRNRGLEPFLTLHHFTNPRWIAAEGGWENDKTAELFARFANQMAREFGSRVRFWLTLNEPNIYTFHSCITGSWPPGKRSLNAARRTLVNLAKGHILAYHAIWEAYRGGVNEFEPSVGYAQNLMILAGYARWSPLDQCFARLADYVFNRAFMAAITTGFSALSLPGFRRGGVDLPEARPRVLDFIGVNYYTRAHLRFPTLILARNGAPTNDLGWEIYPDGIYEALLVAHRYATQPDGKQIPIYVTENGIDDRSGHQRNFYLVAHLEAVHRAIAAGIDVRGYFHWTLMDNFEWAEGYEPRFGLYRVDRSDNLSRIETPTVGLYQRIIAQNALDPEILNQYVRR